MTTYIHLNVRKPLCLIYNTNVVAIQWKDHFFKYVYPTTPFAIILEENRLLIIK